MVAEGTDCRRCDRDYEAEIATGCAGDCVRCGAENGCDGDREIGTDTNGDGGRGTESGSETYRAHAN